MSGNSTVFFSMSAASLVEIMVPPALILGAIYASLVFLWLKTHGLGFVRVFLRGRLLPLSSVDVAEKPTREGNPNNEHHLQSLLSEDDRCVLASIRDNTNTFKEFVKIVFPMTMSLAFCPLTLFAHRHIVEGFWPPDKHPKAPNINDSIACFLVPAGMVYAISFGFAFQAVFSRNQETDRCIGDEVNRLNRIISLVCRLQLPSLQTKLLILKNIKDEILTLVQDVLGTKPVADYDTRKEGFQDLVLCLPTPGPSSTDSVLRSELVKLITSQVYTFDLKCPHKQRLHPVMWLFLETLGYFNFLAMLLVQTHSYRMDLSLCIVTVVSISLLCFVVADLDSPLHGFFRANLSVLTSLVNRLDVIYRVFVDSGTPSLKGKANKSIQL